ncbi:hypothetical protein RAJCM14343_2558 [Rhodococcus aetherivorans]|uniref:Uncharacterized protein n=1 Tax=Rhodococcus aetherivorans TaxID=191292 RepID=A0ABQ0YLG6_9NOCA|nr:MULTISPECIES: hypothetical protein [Rhodococcus]OOL31690.1 hypothetical protein GQ85_12070 [Rhodococcus rhodochrous]KDE12119.1 hypothetical protein N505_0117645 [Rhodococcus aetherivorans]MBC2588904.1 hypothetical protein [Rhodococcus aetherivorans]MDV6293559.1 hypothetical protein [Rhodococcus aetherivorans]OLL18598.1 hypothetical protein BKE56_000350 [Rhodococcus sp. M8]
MNGRTGPDPVRVAVGAAATVGDGIRRMLLFGVDAARRLPGVDPALVALEARGAETLRAGDEIADRLLRAVVRRVVSAALDEVDITAVVRDHVDLDAVAEGVDVERIVGRVDLDAIAARVDIAPILDRVDIDAVAERVDVGAIIDRVDLDAVAATIDVGAIIDRVDLDAVAATIDVDAIIGRVDLIGLANAVIEGVDLPTIIRESTGSMSTEAMRGVRSQGMHADDAVSGFVGRLFGRAEIPEEPA